MARVLKIRDLTLRDGQQSSFATRMTQAQVDRCLTIRMPVSLLWRFGAVQCPTL